MVKLRVKKPKSRTSVRSAVRALKTDVRKEITKKGQNSKRRVKPSIASREIQVKIAEFEVEADALGAIETPAEKRQEESALRGKVEALKKRFS